MTEEDTFRLLRKVPRADMFDSIVELLPGVWTDDGIDVSPTAIARLHELGWTEEEFLEALMKI